MSDFVTRTISGTLFVAITVAAIVYGAVTFVALFAIISAICTWEFCNLINARRGLNISKLISSVASVYLFLAVMAFATEATGAVIFIPYLITTVYLLISELYSHRKDPLDNWVFAFASQLYVALPFALLNVMAFHVDGYTGAVRYVFTLPLSVMIFLWTNDMGAYCFGSALHKYFPARLFPSVSPHKSWVGSIGGGLLTVAVSLVIAHFFPLMPLPAWVGLALTVVIFGSWGDLVESQLKRTLGVKDSGHFLPGHGGALDRFDSTLLAIPSAVIYLYTIQLL